MIKTLYPVFQHWSAKGSVWIYSDPHFDDPDCKIMDPDWPEPEIQIATLKQYCHKNDTLLLLGDVGDPKYMEQLKCYKVLILGNHDQSATKFKSYFNEIYTGPLTISDKIIISHEPLLQMPYLFNIYGYDHSKWHSGGFNRLNVCSNVIGFKPLNLGALIKDGLISNVPTIHRWTIDGRD